MSVITMQEIENQFSTWKQVDDLISENSKLIQRALDFIDDETIIVFTGAGTSGYIGDFLVEYLNQGSGKDKFKSIYSTNIVANPDATIGQKRVLLVSFARSGNSPESCEALKLTTKYAAVCEHLIITCNERGELAMGYPENSILLPAITNDLGFAMTNSFSTMLLTAAKVFGIECDISKLADEAKCLYEQFDYSLTNNLDYENIVYLANSENVGLLNELKLKLMELTNGKLGYYSDQFLNFRHGPKSVITKQSLIIMITSTEEIAIKYEQDLINELLADENKPLVVCLGTKQAGVHASISTELTGFERAMAFVPLCQKIAVNKSLELEINPDNPSPSGSVNRVVQGVTIHGRENVN